MAGTVIGVIALTGMDSEVYAKEKTVTIPIIKEMTVEYTGMGTKSTEILNYNADWLYLGSGSLDDDLSEIEYDSKNRVIRKISRSNAGDFIYKYYYEGDRRTKEVCDEDGYTATYNYNESGQLISIDYGNSISYYNKKGRLKRFDRFEVKYDSHGNVKYDGGDYVKRTYRNNRLIMSQKEGIRSWQGNIKTKYRYKYVKVKKSLAKKIKEQQWALVNFNYNNAF